MAGHLPGRLCGLETPISRRAFLGCALVLLHLTCLARSKPIQSEAAEVQKGTREDGVHMKIRPNRKPAAHFEADPSMHGTLRWRSDTHNGLLRGELILSNNTLRIASGGLYFVYTQATFMAKECPWGRSIHLSHGVSLLSDQYPGEVLLLSAQKTACGEQAGATLVRPIWSKTIYQGGVFALEEGDLLSTVTAGEEYLRLLPGETYFGVYAV